MKWIILGLLLHPMIAVALPPVELTNNIDRYNLTGHLEYFLDKESLLSIDAVAQGKFDDRFIEAENNFLNFGYTHVPLWLKFRVKNPTAEKFEFFVEMNFLFINQVDFFYLDKNNQLKKITTGTDYPRDSRDVDNRNFVFKQQLDPYAERTYYFHLKSTTGALATNLYLSTILGFSHYIEQQNFILGIYFGLIGVMIFYNLFLYFSVRDSAYLYYVFFIFSSAFLQVGISGLGYYLSWSDIGFINISAYVGAILTAIGSLLFGRKFLQTNQFFPRADKIILLLILANIISLLCVVVGIVIPEAIVLEAVAGTTTLLIIGLLSFLKGYRPALYFFIAYFFFAIGSIIISLTAIGFLPASELTLFSFAAGGMLEATLLSLALGYRIHLLRIEHFEAETAAKQAKRENEAKSEFFAKMSHEIRTPLNGVLGIAELLKDPDLTQTQRLQYIDTINSSGKTLINIINEVLDYSKIEAGKVLLESMEFDLPKFLSEILRLFEATAKLKNVKLNYTIDDNVPNFLIGDPNRLRQILLNLIGNALKFTEQGSVTLTIKLEYTENSNVMLRFLVIDTGKGISLTGQHNLFKPFSQADTTISRTHGGTGLGLIISKQLVDLMHGDIGVISEEGKGSTFWFTVLVQKLDHFTDMSLTNENEILQTDAEMFRKLRLLIAEDNPVNQMVIKGLLKKLGVTQITTVSNGNAVLSTFSQNPDDYDVILMDCEMPEMNGYDATRKIREFELANNKNFIPIIALTAHTSEEYRQLSTAAGMDFYLVKPLILNELRELLMQVSMKRLDKNL